MDQLPYNELAEKEVISSLIVNGEDVIRYIEQEDLTEDDFFKKENKTIFSIIMELYDSGQPIEIGPIVDLLTAKNKLNEIGGIDYLAEIAEVSVGTSNVDYYIKEVRKNSDSRKLVNKLNVLSKKGYDKSIAIDDLLDDVENEVLELTRHRRGVSEFKKADIIANSVQEELKHMRENPDMLNGLSTGLRDLDDITNGLQNGDLIILAARPSVGKTAFALNLAKNIATKKEKENLKTVAIFSLEMPAEQLMKRIVSCESGVFGEKLRSGNINNNEMNQIASACAEISNMEMYIDDTSGITISEIFSKCRKLKSKKGSNEDDSGLDLIVIDYLQLIQGSNRHRGDRQQEVSEISRSLKILAKEMNVPVIALSQLSRSVEQRQDKTPQLSDLRESGSIEQDADIVMFLSRPDYGVSDEQKQEELAASGENNKVVLSIKKHRNGSLADLEFKFEKEISRFKDCD